VHDTTAVVHGEVQARGEGSEDGEGRGGEERRGEERREDMNFPPLENLKAGPPPN
jgi:hypothetical protein